MDSSPPSVRLLWSALRRNDLSTCLEFLLLVVSLLVCHIREREDSQGLAPIRRLIALKEVDFYAYGSRGRLQDVTRCPSTPLSRRRGAVDSHAVRNAPPRSGACLPRASFFLLLLSTRREEMKW